MPFPAVLVSALPPELAVSSAAFPPASAMAPRPLQRRLHRCEAEPRHLVGTTYKVELGRAAYSIPATHRPFLSSTVGADLDVAPHWHARPEFFDGSPYRLTGLSYILERSGCPNRSRTVARSIPTAKLSWRGVRCTRRLNTLLRRLTRTGFATYYRLTAWRGLNKRDRFLRS